MSVYERYLTNKIFISRITIKKLQHQLEIQTKRVENLKKSLSVYESESRWSHGKNQLEPTFILIGNETDAKLFAKRAITIDQELEKELEEVK